MSGGRGLPSLGVGILGLGTVGGGVASQLLRQVDFLSSRAAGPLHLVKAADLSPARARELGLPAELVAGSAKDVVSNPDVQIVAELIGGRDPAGSLVLEALRRGKHVITANKLLMASRGREILEQARASRRLILYGASVAGGIPVLRTIRSGLVATRVEFILGILNGTCNYMLTRMSKDGMDFTTALAEAQERGYAEADPTLDVNGTDAAQKAAILAGSAFRRWVEWRRVFVEGIEKITPEDHAEAARLGYVIKLLAIARRDGERLDVRVHPTLIPEGYLLASVEEAFNAVYLRGETSGPLLLYGLGAGRWPTASAVLGDIITAARYARGVQVESTGIEIDYSEEAELVPMDEVVCHHFVRMRLQREKGALARVTAVMAEHDIGIASLANRSGMDFVMLTMDTVEANMRRAATALSELDCVKAMHSIIRVEERRSLPREPELTA